MNLPEIAAVAEPTPLFLAGTALLLIGIFFKIAAVPFHMWTPDVYEGTPTPLTAYMATASKSATFVAFIFVVSRMLPLVDLEIWTNAIQVIAFFTLIVGNLITMSHDYVM